MSAFFTIKLQNLHFFAKHGLYAEEADVGAEFEVSLSLILKAPKAKTTSLEETINYAEVYHITGEIFSVRRNLLETLAIDIADALKDQYPNIKEISVQITKVHPPIESFTGSVAVSYDKRYKG